MPRDTSKPYTPEELEDLRAIFQKMPSYKTGGWISAKDIPNLIEAFEFPRTPEEALAYQEHWEKHCGGIVTLEHFLQSASVVHSTSQYARDYAVKFDTDGNGYINAQEFEHLMKLMRVHDPKLQGKTYADFLSEADIDKDGKVDIDECTKWIEHHCSI